MKNKNNYRKLPPKRNFLKEIGLGLLNCFLFLSLPIWGGFAVTGSLISEAFTDQYNRKRLLDQLRGRRSFFN